MSDNLGDREFFDARPDQDVRRRPVGLSLAEIRECLGP